MKENPFENVKAKDLQKMYTEGTLYNFNCEVAQHRSDLHIGQSSTRPWSPDYEKVGIAGELKWSVVSGMDPDLSDRPGSDDFDFMSKKGPIDIKTRTDPWGLPVEVSKIKPKHIYILGKFTNKDVAFLGWSYGWEVMKSKVDNFNGTKMHLKPIPELHSMDSLYDLLDIDAPRSGILTL